jgi:hypothetical protein
MGEEISGRQLNCGGLWTHHQEVIDFGRAEVTVVHGRGPDLSAASTQPLHRRFPSSNPAPNFSERNLNEFPTGSFRQWPHSH